MSGTATGTGVANGNYHYDGNHKRVRGQVNGQVIYNVFDASSALVTVKETLAGSDKITDYVSGPAGSLARLVNGVLTYVHTDHFGSPRAMTSTVGAITAEAIYSPFGLEVNHTIPDNQGGFTGHIRDGATGLNYMQARYYDPVMGRFLSMDPVGFMDTGAPGQVNKYAYTWNDPINGVDPDGRICVPCGVVISYVVSEARRGAIKGAAAGVGTSLFAQSIIEQKISSSVTIVSGIKGALVGATQEVFEIPVLTGSVAAIAGFVDGAVTELVDEGSTSSAITQGLIVGVADYSAAYGGAKLGDETGAEISVAASTIIAKAPAVAEEIQRLSQSVSKKVGTSFSVFRGQLGSLIQQASPEGDEQERYDQEAEG